jgi:hypothetical protein
VAGEAETCPVCGNSPPTALCKHDPRFIALASPPRSEGVRASEVQSGDATCYIERSKVREILIASNIDNESTAEVLTEVDALPIFVAGDFAPAAQASPSLRKVEAEGGFNLVIADKWAAFFPAECESQIDFLIERLSVPSADRGGK